jgi:hypothetical protein
MELFSLGSNAKLAHILCRDARALVLLLIFIGIVPQMRKINQYAEKIFVIKVKNADVEMDTLNLDSNAKLVLFRYKDVPVLVLLIHHGLVLQIHGIIQYVTTVEMELFNLESNAKLAHFPPVDAPVLVP